jgi:hypothetical protein
LRLDSKVRVKLFKKQLLYGIPYELASEAVPPQALLFGACDGELLLQLFIIINPAGIGRDHDRIWIHPGHGDKRIMTFG